MCRLQAARLIVIVVVPIPRARVGAISIVVTVEASSLVGPLAPAFLAAAIEAALSRSLAATFLVASV